MSLKVKNIKHTSAIISKSERLLKPLLFILLIFLVGILFYRKLLIFVVLAAGGGFLHYLCYRRDIKLNFGHIFFLAVILARVNSPFSAVLFLVFAGFFPELLAGHIEGKTFVSYPVQILFIFLSVIFRNTDIMLLGVIITFFNYILTFFLSQLIGEPIGEQILETGLPMVMNIIYFLSASIPLAYTLRILIPV